MENSNSLDGVLLLLQHGRNMLDFRVQTSKALKPSRWMVVPILNSYSDWTSVGKQKKDATQRDALLAFLSAQPSF